MWDFIVKYGVEFALGLVSAGLGAFCKHLMKERKQYQELIEQEEMKKQDEYIDEKINPIIDEIEQIRTYLRNLESADTKKFDIIISSYRFRLCHKAWPERQQSPGSFQTGRQKHCQKRSCF